MKQFKVVAVFLIIQFWNVNAQDTISHIIGGCVYNGLKTSYDEAPCPLGVFFYYSNDTLIINGTIGANCCGTHFALIQTLNDTIFISTVDIGDLCLCTCGFCFEIRIPASITDTIVELNGTFYNTKSGLYSIDNVYDKTIEIIPNPFDNQLIIRTDLEIFHTIWICDVSGRVIRNIDYSNSKEIIIDTKSMHSGIYLIKFETTNKKTITKKIIKN